MRMERTSGVSADCWSGIMVAVAWNWQEAILDSHSLASNGTRLSEKYFYACFGLFTDASLYYLGTFQAVSSYSRSKLATLKCR